VQIEPQYRTKIKSYLTEHKIRPVTTKERIVVGARVPADVKLEAVPADSGSVRPPLSLGLFRRPLADAGTRTGAQEID
jgi:hypothetical protein